MEKNPFLEDDEDEEEIEETYVVHKPFKKQELTEAQKERNFKGLDLFKEALKKAGINIKDYKKEVN